jgi:hypothetical protein
MGNHAGAAGVLMNVRAEIRWLKARLATVEGILAARPPRRKRVGAPRPTDPIIAAREKLWARYVLLDVAHRGRITKLAFAIRHRLNPTEFCRWFSGTDTRGIPEGSAPALRFYQALNDVIAELEARARGGDQKAKAAIAGIASDSHGKVAHSQFSNSRPQ